MHYPHHQTTHRKLWKFHGGLHLPDNKTQSTGHAIGKLPLPEKLLLPLQQHIGSPATATVKPGDTVKKGDVIAKPQGYISAAIHAPTSGIIAEISEHPLPHPSGLAGTCVVLESDGKDEWSDNLPEPITDFRNTSTHELRERIRWAGIVGLGGATFPSGIKLNPGPDKKIDTLVVNAAECEPYISCDDMLMREHSDTIVEGILITLHILDAPRCMIGIEDNKPEAIKALQEATREQDNIEVVVIPTLYPSGGEKQLIYILTGKQVPGNGLPADIGIVCHNVATLYSISHAVLRGHPLISRIVTVTGPALENPCNIEVPNGTLIRDLVSFSGGYKKEPGRLIMGGPMMGFTLKSELIPVIKGTNCILAIDEDELPLPPPPMPCIRCGKCADVCPANLLPQQLYWYSRARDFDKTQDYNLFDCIECGCCSHVCPSHIPLVQYYRFSKTEIWTQEVEKRKADKARQRHEFRETRLARIEAARKERMRRKKEALEKKKGTGNDPKKAAIEAAMKRAAEKKLQLKSAGKTPANTENLTEAQKKQIQMADKRRHKDSP